MGSSFAAVPVLVAVLGSLLWRAEAVFPRPIFGQSRTVDDLVAVVLIAVLFVVLTVCLCV